MRVLCLVFLILSTGVNAQKQMNSWSAADSVKYQQSRIQQLLGVWEIDLRPSPDAPPYLKTVAFAAYNDQTLSGLFYDTQFSDGKLNLNWDKIYFAFTTADNSGVYYHSGVLENNQLSGVTFSKGRQFVMPWRSIRKK